MAALTGRTLLIQMAGQEFAAQCFSARVEGEAADDKDVTFAEAAAGGGRLYKLALRLTQDMAASTVWTKIWEAAGSDVAITMKPYGNTTATITQPHFTMSANVREPDGVLIGGDANASTTARNTIEVEWPLAAKPTRVTA